MIKIKEIQAVDTHAIRLKILRNGISLPVEFNGDNNNDTVHLGAFKNKNLIAVSSFMKLSNKNILGNQYQLRGMAVLDNFQGYGIGKLLLNEAINIFKKKNIDYIWCNARKAALNFYKKQGFQILGDEFQIQFIGEHFFMFKKL